MKFQLIVSLIGAIAILSASLPVKANANRLSHDAFNLATLKAKICDSVSDQTLDAQKEGRPDSFSWLAQELGKLDKKHSLRVDLTAPEQHSENQIIQDKDSDDSPVKELPGIKKPSLSAGCEPPFPFDIDKKTPAKQKEREDPVILCFMAPCPGNSNLLHPEN